MFSPRLGILVCAALVAWAALAASGSAPPLATEAFTESRFRELQAQNALILVDVTADWCPTCSHQRRVIARYLEKRPDVELHVLELDFDRQRDWVVRLKAPQQSTLLLFRGSTQLWFSVAETREEVIYAAIDEAI